MYASINGVEMHWPCFVGFCQQAAGRISHSSRQEDCPAQDIRSSQQPAYRGELHVPI